MRKFNDRSVMKSCQKLFMAAQFFELKDSLLRINEFEIKLEEITSTIIALCNNSL